MLPRLLTLNKPLNRLTNLILASSDLLRRISIPQCECVVFDGLEVYSDTKRSTQFVVASVAFANAGGGVIDSV